MRMIFAIGVLLAITPTSVKASDRLSEIESAFVGVAAASFVVVGNCDHFAVVKDGIPKLADRLGIDDRLQAAVRAAFKITVNLPYERSDLMPAVTQLFRETNNSIAGEMEENKTRACARWIDALRKIGVIE